MFLVLAAATTLAMPAAVGMLVDRGFADRQEEAVWYQLAMFAALAVMLALASAGRFYFIVNLGERVVTDVRTEVFAHLTKLSASFYDRTQSGEIVARLTSDAVSIKAAVGTTAAVALRNIILAIGAVSMMVITSPRLSGLVISILPFIVILLMTAGRGVRRRSRHAQDLFAEASAFAAEQLASMRTVQALTAEDAADANFASLSQQALKAHQRTIVARALLTFVAILTIFLSIVALLWLGSNAVIAGSMTPGTLSQFILYAVFAAGSLGALSEVWGELCQAAGAADRIHDVLAEVPEIVPPAMPASLPVLTQGSIEFRNVTFSYPGNVAHHAIQNLNFAVEPGETVAIVGHSGAGKSTICSLLMRCYDPQGGSILLDGYDIRSLGLHDLRSRIAYVPQDPKIFADTVRRNITLGLSEQSAWLIERAAQRAVAAEFIEGLPLGYETKLGEDGADLSGGQRQRLALARAILREAPILVLDEATSALDAENEAKLQLAIDRSKADRTTIIIAHRLATVVKADRILVLDAGRLVETGTHCSLLARHGIYARFAKLQLLSQEAPELVAAE